MVSNRCSQSASHTQNVLPRVADTTGTPRSSMPYRTDQLDAAGLLSRRTPPKSHQLLPDGVHQRLPRSATCCHLSQPSQTHCVAEWTATRQLQRTYQCVHPVYASRMRHRQRNLSYRGCILGDIRCTSRCAAAHVRTPPAPGRGPGGVTLRTACRILTHRPILPEPADASALERKL